MNRTVLIFSLFIFLFSCKKQTEKNSNVISVNKKIVKNKWINQEDCFANLKEYKPTNGFEHTKLNIYRKKSDSSYYFLTCRYDGVAYLNKLSETVDIESLEDKGQFWIDKNHVYYEYLMSDGIILKLLNSADRKTFKIFGKTNYAKDKNHIFSSRHGIIKNADLETFQPISINKKTGRSSYAKDKNNYFFWNEIVTDTIELKKFLKLK